MTKKIAIIGAGPAGLFAAYELVKNSKFDIEIYDKGREINKRLCPRERKKNCIDCKPCNVHCGIGGAGLMSDGKLLFHTRIGNNLNEIISEEKNQQLVNKVEEIFSKYGVKLNNENNEKIIELKRKALQKGIEFVYSKQAHIGSDKLPDLMKNFQKDLEKKGVKFSSKKEISSLEELSGKDYILIAPGREGSQWLEKILKKEKIQFGYRPVDIGIRVEVPREITDSITNITRDMKFYVNSEAFNDRIRTFCTCPGGHVTQENHDEFVLVNGYSDSKSDSSNTNFAVLTTIPLINSNTNHFASLMAQLGYTLRNGKKITVQRYGDLKRGRRSKEQDNSKYELKPTLKEAEWGDISLIFVGRCYINLLEGLDKFNKIIPGLTNDSTLLYAPEMKFHGLKIKTNEYLRASDKISVAGDGAGFSRGIIGAAASGILAAEGILKNI